MEELGFYSLKEPHWFAIYTRPNHEKCIFRAIKSFEVEGFFPTRLKRKRVNGRYVPIEEPLFRSYLFAKLIPRTPEYYYITDLKGVVGFVCKSGIPVPIKEQEINSVKILCNRAKDLLFSIPKLEKGDWIEITDGPFKGVIGRVMKVSPEKFQLIVNINALGQGASMYLPLDAIRKTNPTRKRRGKPMY